MSRGGAKVVAEVERKLQPALRIASKLESGFRRAGRLWTPAPQTVPLSSFTDSEVKALVGEQALSVEHIEVDS